jgi:hypothetical protein
MALLVLAFAGLNVRVDSGQTTPSSVHSGSLAMRFSCSTVAASCPSTWTRCGLQPARCWSTCPLAAAVLFRDHVDRLSFERRGEVEALTRKMERQDPP